MPIYEYRCDSCGHEMEIIQKMSESPLKDCPSCEAPSLRKLVSAAGFRLKGAGWYETDFKGGSDKKKNLAGETDTKSTDKSESTSDTKADTKSDTKAETKSDTKTETKTNPKPAPSSDSKSSTGNKGGSGKAA